MSSSQADGETALDEAYQWMVEQNWNCHAGSPTLFCSQVRKLEHFWASDVQ